MTRVSKKAPAKKKAPSARTQKKQTRTVKLAAVVRQRAKAELTKLATILSPE